jgi:quercetin dioxygenase-like cupin family protein
MKPTDNLKGQAFSLAGAVAYSDGAIVSKTILDKKQAGSLTLFAFDAGQGLSEHTSPYDATVMIAEGKARITIGGKVLTASAGELVIMPAHVPHDVWADERFKMLLIMIRAKD